MLGFRLLGSDLVVVTALPGDVSNYGLGSIMTAGAWLSGST